MTETVLLARQPIYDARLNVVAYELLFRAGDAQSAVFQSGGTATSTVLMNAFTSLPITDVLDGKPAYVNFTRELLDFTPPVDPSQLVVEVLEDVVIDADSIAAIAKLKEAGYKIALDDYVYFPHHAELLKLVDIVKVDVLTTPLPQVASLVARLRPLKLSLLAEKIETQAMYKACRSLGFELFQGFFLSRPEIVKGRKLNVGQQTALQLMTALRKPGIEIKEIERLIQTDAVLALRVLKLVNSPLFALSRPIDSIGRAVALLGIDRIRSLAQMMLLAGLESKPQAQFAGMLLRARLGELMAQRSKQHDINAESQFTVGLLSTLDAYLDMDFAEILTSVPIPDAMKEAILHHSGTSGALLDASVGLERGDFGTIDWARLQSMGMAPANVRDLYIDSVRWVSEVMRTVT